MGGREQDPWPTEARMVQASRLRNMEHSARDIP
jgi:hypothetical protein